jgi:hypothetical protein
MLPKDELALLLKPAGGGLYLVSTGRAEQLALQRSIYRASNDEDVAVKFSSALARIPDAKGVLLGVPSDVGAGFRRGANLGPQAIRTALLAADPDWPERAEAMGLVDIGDVFVVPQLLHDDMLSEAQKAATRAALYPTLGATTLVIGAALAGVLEDSDYEDPDVWGNDSGDADGESPGNEPPDVPTPQETNISLAATDNLFVASSFGTANTLNLGTNALSLNAGKGLTIDRGFKIDAGSISLTTTGGAITIGGSSGVTKTMGE